MKKLIYIVFFLGFYSSTYSQNKTIDPSDLIGCWKDYSEENKFHQKSNVYRPCDYQSIFHKKGKRFRFKIHFKENGNCSYLSIGANDIHLMKPGKWIYDSTTNELEVFDLEMKSIIKYRIQRLEKQLLTFIIS